MAYPGPYTFGFKTDKPVLQKTASLDFGSIAASDSGELTVSVPGAKVGEHVTVCLADAAGIDVELSYTARVSAADTVTVRASNGTGGAIDPAAANFSVIVHKLARP